MVFSAWIKGIFISRHFILTPVYQDWSGGGAVRGSDPKGVNVNGVGLDIRLLCYMICFRGAGGKHQGRIQDLKLGWGSKTHPG